MSKLIAFSGGCFSGKTTTLKKFKSYLEGTGRKVVVLDELIRTATDEPIDVVRKNPSAYLHLQEKVIRHKIKQELEALADTSDTIYLADRAITDSLFYLQNYVDKSSLSDEEMKAYCVLHKEVVEHAKMMYDLKNTNYKYFAVVEFSPTSGTTDDKFRPKHIDVSKWYEHDAIHILNTSFATRLFGDMLTTQIIYFNVVEDCLFDLFYTLEFKIEHDEHILHN